MSEHISHTYGMTEKGGYRAIRVRVPTDWTWRRLRNEIESLFSHQEVSCGLKLTDCFASLDPEYKRKTAILFVDVNISSWFRSLCAELKAKPLRWKSLQPDLPEVQCNLGCLGLTTLYDRKESMADIVLVHELGGHAVDSWTVEEGWCWPRNLLGGDLETCRILTFGYISSAEDHSMIDYDTYSRQLMDALLRITPSEEAPSRPLILFGLGSGGTVIAQTLELLKSDGNLQSRSSFLYDCIKSLVFFGVSARGNVVLGGQAPKNIQINVNDQGTNEDITETRSRGNWHVKLADRLDQCGNDMQLVLCHYVCDNKNEDNKSSIASPSAISDPVHTINIPPDAINIPMVELPCCRQLPSYRGLKIVLNAVLKRIESPFACAPLSRSLGCDKYSDMEPLQRMGQWEQIHDPFVDCKLEICRVSMSADHRCFAVACRDQKVRLWDLDRPGTSWVDLSGHEEVVVALAFHPKRNVLCSGDGAGVLMVWKRGKQATRVYNKFGKRRQDDGSTEMISALAFCPVDNKPWIASGSERGNVRLWDYQKGKFVTEFLQHGGAVWAIAFSHDGTLMASAVSEIRLWDPVNRRCVAMLQGHTGPVRSLSFLRDGTGLVSGSKDRTIRLWRPSSDPHRKKWHQVMEWGIIGDGVEAIRVIEDPHLAISVVSRADKQQYRVETGDETEPKHHPISAEISSDGKYAFVGCEENRVLFFEKSDKEEIAEATTDLVTVVTYPITPRGPLKRYLSALTEGQARFWIKWF